MQKAKRSPRLEDSRENFRSADGALRDLASAPPEEGFSVAPPFLSAASWREFRLFVIWTPGLAGSGSGRHGWGGSRGLGVSRYDVHQSKGAGVCRTADRLALWSARADLRLVRTWWDLLWALGIHAWSRPGSLRFRRCGETGSVRCSNLAEGAGLVGLLAWGWICPANIFFFSPTSPCAGQKDLT